MKAEIKVITLDADVVTASGCPTDCPCNLATGIGCQFDCPYDE